MNTSVSSLRSGAAWGMLASVLLLLLWSCAPLPQSMPQPEPRAPGSARELSEQFVQQQGGIYADAELADYVRKRGLFWGRRSRQPERPWSFDVLDRSAAEVHLLPHGKVFLTRGLVASLHSWRQLESVLKAAAAEAAEAASRGPRTFSLEAILARSETISGPLPSGAEIFAVRLEHLQQLVPGYERYAVGRRQEKAGDLAGAIRSYLQAATLAPEQAQILTGLGLAYLQLGDLPAARTHLNRAVRLQPDYYLSRMGSGYISLQQRDYKHAIAQLERSVALLPIVRNRYLLAESYAKDGQVAKAQVLFRDVVAADRWGKFGRAAAKHLKELEMQE